MTLGKRFGDALQYAITAHDNHVRKGTEIPYISHLLGVASLVIEHHGSEDEAIAALLHDAVEDAGGLPRLKDIQEKFGNEVARIVEGCTDAYTDPKPPWRPRKEAYINHLSDADESILLVAAADKLHNVRAILRDYREIGERLWTRFNATKEEELWYYRSLSDTFNARMGGRLVPLCTELDHTVSELEALAGKKERLTMGG